MKRCFIESLLFFFLISETCQAAIASSRSQREHGEELFKANGCLHCHTMGNVGGHKGPNLSGVGRTTKSGAIRRQIVEGGNQMPAFGDVFEQKELDDLVKYLRSCKTKTQKQ